ncbi:MAG: penicillin-binding protein 2, partial [Bdellovibrionales bacterium]|nr:penicillin-binding protein 2 [Bdellovibrionales bacterium]
MSSAIFDLLFLQHEYALHSHRARESYPAGKARLIALAVVFLLLTSAVVTRLYFVQIEYRSFWLKRAQGQHETEITVAGARGRIIDSAGRILASSIQAGSLALHPGDVAEQERPVLAARLGSLLDRPAKDIETLLAKKTPFVWLERGLPIELVDSIGAEQLSGVVVLNEFRRYYPQGPLAGSVLGWVGRDRTGLSGVERAFDQALSATSLEVPVRRDARGHFVAAMPDDQTSAPSSLLSRVAFWGAGPEPLSNVTRSDAIRHEGGEIQLSIDSYVQAIVEEEFERGRAAARSKRVFGVVMDADSGEVLAMAAAPRRFNPNEIDGVSPRELRNEVIQDSFEPGSTLKPIVASAVLDSGLVSANERLDCEASGRYRVGPHIVRDVHPVGIGTLRDVLVRSSNICMAKLGQRLGARSLYRALRDFGLGQSTEIELPGEASGILRSPEQWKTIDVATHSFGQGVAVTSLQLVRAYATLANGGYLVQPTILKRNAGA